MNEKKYQCPWCGHTGVPMKTSDHLDEAAWKFAGIITPADVARNPYMCEECHQVGGREDWVL